MVCHQKQIEPLEIFAREEKNAPLANRLEYDDILQGRTSEIRYPLLRLTEESIQSIDLINCDVHKAIVYEVCCSIECRLYLSYFSFLLLFDHHCLS